MIKPPRLPTVEGRTGWEARWQLTLIEPAETAEEVGDIEIHPKPRLNVVVSTVVTSAEDETKAVREFLQTVSSIPGFAVEEPTAGVTFDDRQQGARVVVSFPAEDIKLRQVHLFRIDKSDDAVLTQIVITADADRPRKEMEDLERAALRFSPENGRERASGGV